MRTLSSLILSSLIVSACSRGGESPRSGPDGGSPPSDAAGRDSGNVVGSDAGGPVGVAFRVTSSIDWASSAPFSDDHAFTLMIYDVEAESSTAAFIASGGKLASFILTRGNDAWTAAPNARIDFTPAADVVRCTSDGPIEYESLSIRVTRDGSGYRVAGSATGEMRGIRGDISYQSDFTATLIGQSENDAPQVVYATTQAIWHPLDTFSVYFSEPLDATATALLVGDSNTIRLTNAGASVNDVGPFIRAFVGDGRPLPWGATMNLQLSGSDLTGLPINGNPSSVSALNVIDDPGIFDETQGFEAESVNALLLNGAQIVAREDLGLPGEGHVAFIPTGDVALDEEHPATHVSGRMSLRIPILDAENTISFDMALYAGPFGAPTFQGRIEGILPRSDRRLFVEELPRFVAPSSGSITDFERVTWPVGSRAADEDELLLDFIAQKPQCGLPPPAITGIIIDRVVVDE